ncbi:hypothetical protein HXX76_012244 [Chlamydomonas incerta]|uniref:Uncharacterized protein n=1 Tax=Chlamydomonas incerta TaxID=51695 RepID=A0A835SVL1_CHLIN|nr:hypothetical protein HXX76_012244 [Chlamydomonas incerta]|eukprot:KAG2427590.1 hypothetical protein HXX76_012244 [Chlamydomonas incerta]
MTARRLYLAALLSMVVGAGIAVARNDIGLPLGDNDTHGRSLKGATPSAGPAADGKKTGQAVQCNNGNGKGNGKSEACDPAPPSPMPPCPASATNYLTTAGSTSEFPFLTTCGHRVSCSDSPLELVVRSASSYSLCVDVRLRSIARSDLGWCPTATCMGMLNGLAEVRLQPSASGAAAPTSATVNGAAVPITHPYSGSSTIIISLASLTAADIAAEHATVCLSTTAYPATNMQGFVVDLPYYMAGVGTQRDTSSPATGVYLTQYEVTLRYALVSADQACCTEECGAGFTVQREHCDVSSDPTANRCTTSSAYSTCVGSVANADCVNACTVGCRFNLASLSSFADKNPTGCCRCLTNSNGWCGCGKTVNYCCAA